MNSSMPRQTSLLSLDVHSCWEGPAPPYPVSLSVFICLVWRSSYLSSFGTPLWLLTWGSSTPSAILRYLQAYWQSVLSLPLPLSRFDCSRSTLPPPLYWFTPPSLPDPIPFLILLPLYRLLIVDRLFLGSNLHFLVSFHIAALSLHVFNLLSIPFLLLPF